MIIYAKKKWQKIKKSFVKPHALHPFLHGTSKTRVPDPLLSSGVPGNDSDHVKIDDRIDYLQNCGNDGLLRYVYISIPSSWKTTQLSFFEEVVARQ